MKMIEQHNNQGSYPESQVAVQQVSGTNKAQLAFRVCEVAKQGMWAQQDYECWKAGRGHEEVLDLRHTH